MKSKHMAGGAALFAITVLISCSNCGGGTQSPSTPDQSGTGETSGGGGEEGDTLFVGPELRYCVGSNPMWCSLTRETPEGEWQFAYDSIQGFTQEVGTSYELRVRRENVPNPLADGSSIRTILVEIVSQEQVRAPRTPIAECEGQPIRLTPRVETSTAGTSTVRTLTLGLTFCDGSTADYPIGVTSAAWVLPWHTEHVIDPEGEEAGALFSAYANSRDREQTVIRVIPREGAISIETAVRPWTVEAQGAVGQNPLEFRETNRIHTPASTSVELVRGEEASASSQSPDSD